MPYLFETMPEPAPSGPGESPVMGWNAPKLRPRLDSAAITDPAEPWEIPVPRRDRYKIDRMLPGRPFRPAKPADLPGESQGAPESVCGQLPLERLYVVPRTARLVNPTECVITPTRERLDSLSRDGQSLQVQLALPSTVAEPTTSVSLPLDHYLVEAMWRAFGDSVRWA